MCKFAEKDVLGGFLNFDILSRFDFKQKKTPKLHTCALNITSEIPIVNSSGRFLNFF